MKTISKLAIPISCLMLLCSCGTDAAANTDSGSKKSEKKETINLNDYFYVKYDGNDTIGKVTTSGVDTERLFKDHPTAFGLKEPYVADAASAMVNQTFRDNSNYTLSYDSFLSNGDTIGLQWNDCYKSLNDKYNVELITEDMQITVEGLPELQEINPFDYVETVFAQGSTNDLRRVILDQKDGLPLNVGFIKDKEEVANGEKVTITVVSDINGYTAEQAYAVSGLKPTLIEKEYIADFSE